jgi:acetolactate synthase-1/2/3 large subunit
MLKVFTDNGVDRTYIVPGESYLGILDALNDFNELDVVVCRHEGSAAFMALVDGRLTGRPGLVMVSRGPGATNASIGIHAAQQDGVPLILIVGQIPKGDLRKDAFQEIDYQKMFGSMAKWVYEVTAPEDLATAAFKAVRIATEGTPGPVVLVIPEDIQQQVVKQPNWLAMPSDLSMPSAFTLQRIYDLISQSTRPLIIAGSAIARREDGRAALLAFAEKFNLPAAVSFRQNDLFPNDHPLYAGHLDLATPKEQVEAFASSDLVLALGTRLGDITTQGYTFPAFPQPNQTLVHCIADGQSVNKTFAADIGLAVDPVSLIDCLYTRESNQSNHSDRRSWAKSLRHLQNVSARWPLSEPRDGIPFTKVVKELQDQSPDNLVICLDSGTFASSVYKNFSFRRGQRLIASCSGAMGYGMPAAIVAQIRMPSAKVVCMLGDGGFLMTGNEIIAAVDRNLPILFIISNNNCYGSIRVHQNLFYPDRHVGTTLTNPDFVALAGAFGVISERVETEDQIKGAIERGLGSSGPYVLEVKTSLAAALKNAIPVEKVADMTMA